MIEISDKSKCCGCQACYNICPQKAIKMKEDEKGFNYPIVDKEKCINCRLCENACPILNNCQKNTVVDVWAMYNNNLEERMKSSSGGIFSLIAREILNRDGVVFGAMFDENFNVFHHYIDDYESIEKLQGSKYVQSNIGDSFKLVKDFLEQNKYVLFTGTSCQIEGLKSYLQKDYSKLYTQDIICHGVPSPKVWGKYLEFQEKSSKEKIVDLSFRNKDKGWNKFHTKIKFQTKTYRKEHSEDFFMQAFLRNTCLRESCYNCSFKNEYRKSDITLADFWGVNKVKPEINDDMGISLVIINSEKGQEIFNIIKKNCTFEKAKIDHVKNYNSAYLKSVTKDPKAEEFFENFDKMEFNKLVKKYVSRPKKKNVIKKIAKKFLRK